MQVIASSSSTFVSQASPILGKPRVREHPEKTERSMFRENSAPGSVGPTTAKNAADRAEENLQIEPEALIAQVRDGESQAVVKIQLVSSGHLPETCQTWLDGQARRVPQAVGAHVERRRPGPDQTHI